jgi:hypothetical protein
MTTNRELIKTISKLQFEYSPTSNQEELEQWIQLVLAMTYNGQQADKVANCSFKYKDSLIVFVQSVELFNFTKTIKDDSLVEVGLPVSDYLEDEYGVSYLAKAKETIQLDREDFAVMSREFAEYFTAFTDYAQMISTSENKEAYPAITI